jgi:hypothetical protein
VQAVGADAFAEGEQDTSGSTGIILKRQAKSAAAGAGGGQLKDLPALRDTVQKLCQAAMPLARNVELLQEDMEGLAKEYK